MPVRERETSGNLPLSEGLRHSISSDTCRRDVSEEFSRETAGDGEPHASRAGSTVADMMKDGG